METARVLVVDDEKGICRNIKKILSKKDYDVTEAFSAREALDKMAEESFSLVISDIIMPETNGLELLRLVKDQWPLTRVIMMTAYASTDTALKSIRLGALDYIPKPFTPGELRSTVKKALSGELPEVTATEKEKAAINVIDLDVPFDREEVSSAAGEAYADTIGPSDMPVVEIPKPESLPYYCAVGEKVCDIYKKLGATCKAGVKTNECPQLKKAGKKKKVKDKSFDARTLVGIDQPFDYEEVISVTGPEYVRNLQHDGIAFVPYEEVKKNVARLQKRERSVIDVDMPFEREEVEKVAGEGFAEKLTPTDMPAVEVPSPETLAYYCAVGEKVCDIYKKLGATCKAGIKKNVCPQLKKAGKKKAAGSTSFDAKTLIGIDRPFDYEEVVSITGPEYVTHMDRGGIPLYEELKERFLQRTKKETAPSPVRREPAGDGIKATILVIDDEIAVNNNIRKILNKKGYAADQAMTGEDALARIEKRAYDLVILDLKMPGVKGLDLLNAIVERRPGTMVIIVTGYASIETAIETARLGAVDYLPKPFTPDEIRTAAENALRLAA